MKASLSVTAVELAGLDGANPLGFLAALGTVATLQQAGHSGIRLAWRREVRWTPVLHGLSVSEPQQVPRILADALRGREVSPDAEARREAAQHGFEAAKKAFKDGLAGLKKRKLKGPERAVAFEQGVAPLQAAVQEKREGWLAALKLAVPSEELALGKQIDCTAEEYRQHAAAFLATSTHAKRCSVDVLAAFGSDASEGKNGRIFSNPFCFITGSGHQYFLDTVRQLMGHVSAERLARALFEPWEYCDEKLSMRWDPAEDKRYALMDQDPGPLGTRTVWMANLLAYRGLVLFPSAPTRRGLGTTAWGQGRSETPFTWPIWEPPLGVDVIRSLLQWGELQRDCIDHQQTRARGVAAVFRARRIQVGSAAQYKVNFSPARAV